MHTRGSGPEPPYSVLVVDDEPAVRQLLRYYLEEETGDFTVSEAANGREALSEIREDGGDPEVVLLDLSMPEMGGFETLKRITDLERPLVTIVLSGMDGEQKKLRAFELGAVDFVTKPFSPAVLAARLKLNVRRASRAPLVAPVGESP